LLNPTSNVVSASAITYSDHWQTSTAYSRTNEQGECDCKIQVNAENKDTIELRIDLRGYESIGFTGLRGDISQGCSIEINRADTNLLIQSAVDSVLTLTVTIPEDAELSCSAPDYLEGKAQDGVRGLFTVRIDCLRVVCGRTAGTKINLKCNVQVGEVVNPFYNGILGNYRSDKNYFIHTKRTEGEINQAGYLDMFRPFWVRNEIGGIMQNSGSEFDNLWQRGDQITVFNAKGQPIQVSNAINIPSASIYQFNSSHMAANAFNARYTEIAFDGFEEYRDTRMVDYYTPEGCLSSFNHFKLIAISSDLDISSRISDTAHTGNKSLFVQAGSHAEYSFNCNNESSPRSNRQDRLRSNSFILEEADLIKPFGLTPNKDFYLSAWVYIDDPNESTYRDKVQIELVKSPGDGEVILNELHPEGPIIDGWQQIKGEFNIGDCNSSFPFGLRLKNIQQDGKGAYFDDLRIQPFESSIQTYVYSDDYFRLGAILDENNYATYYDYDPEGKLERTKKETEIGVFTVQEIRTELPKKKE